MPGVPRIMGATVAAAAVVVVTSGCLSSGGSSSGGGGGGGGNNSSGSKTVEIMTGFTGDQLTQFEKSVNPYAQSQGITIKWNGTSNFNQLINTRVQGNNLPDIALFPQPGVMKDLATKGKLTPLDSFLDMSTLKSSMTNGTLDAGTVNGHLYALLVSMNVKSLVFYPKQPFTSAGYTAPATIPELLSLTDKIRSSGKTPWCLGIESGAATGWPATDWLEELVLKYGGIDQYNQWVSHQIKFNSPLVKKAADTFQQIAFTPGNVLGGRKSIASNNFATAGNPLFDSPPKCYMYKQGNFVAAKGGFPDKIVANLDNEVGVFGFPPATAGGPNPVEGGGDLAALFSGNSDAAKTILKYMSQSTFGKESAAGGNYLSPHKDFPLSNYPNKTLQDIAQVAYKSTAFAFDGSDAMPGAVGSGSFWKNMTAWISGGMSLEQALSGIDASWPAS